MLTTEYTDVHAVTDYTQAGSGVAGILNGAKLIFAIAPFTPTKTLAVSGITQSVDADLAPASVTWGAAGRDSAGDIVTLTTGLPIKIASDANACEVYGWGLTDSAGTNLLISEAFDTPLNLTDTLSLYVIAIPFAPGNPQGKFAQVTS